MTPHTDPDDLIAKTAAAAKAGKITAETAANMTHWLSNEEYRRYVTEIGKLLVSEQFDKLDTMFWQIVPFGTGGRRGTMGEFGSATINERTIAESAYGLGRYFQEVTGRDSGRAVIGHDTRINSPEFAQLTACTLAALGIQVYFFESHRSTPEISFAVRKLHCDLGVVISASHNPPSDNGFKAMWSNGGQLLDLGDSDAPSILECVATAKEIETVDFETAVADGRIVIIGEDIDNAYFDAVCQLSLSKNREVSVVYSPLHGVGITSVYQVLKRAGFQNVEIFEPHRAADGNFPNVPDHLPNPERTEVFEPIYETAQQSGADIILASDPDADRLAVAVRDAAGQYHTLTGNQIGALLTEYVLQKRHARGDLSACHYVVETLVTTPMIRTIAEAFEVRCIHDLLVGFKYIGKTIDVEGPDLFVFGAEESLGYLAGKYCRDKDAACAGLLLAELAAELRADGKTLLDQLAALYVQYGYHVERQVSKTCPGPKGRQQIDGLMQAFRQTPPTKLADVAFHKVRDYGQHEIRELPGNHKADILTHPSSDLMFFEGQSPHGAFTLALRPSGTEPKIKFYVFAQAACTDAKALGDVKSNTDSAVTALEQELNAWIDASLER